MAVHLVEYYDNGEPSKNGKPAKQATESWGKCSCGRYTTLKHRGGLTRTRGKLQREAKKNHLDRLTSTQW